EGREFLQFLGARARERSVVEDTALDLATTQAVQAIVPVPAVSADVVTVPAAVRTATAIATLEGIARIVFWSDHQNVPVAWNRWLSKLRVPWSHVSGSAGASALRAALDPTAPALVIAPNTIVDARALKDLLAPAVAGRQQTTWLRQDAVVGAY